MTDREAIERLTLAVERLAVGLANELTGTIGTYPDAPIVVAVAQIQSLVIDLGLVRDRSTDEAAEGLAEYR
jgi:hypothetical protein